MSVESPRASRTEQVPPTGAIEGDPLRAQYERHPYPPIPWFALPSRGQGGPLRFERGLRLAGAPSREHSGIRILVAGCGTFEPIVVGQMHPRAAEIVALDMSGSSLRLLVKRMRFARSLAQGSAGILGRRLPPVRPVQADLAAWSGDGGAFDYVLASNVLHHLPNPAAGLANLSALLVPGGLLRVVTYPRHSRLWIRATGAWLRARGVDPKDPAVVRRARAEIRGLAEGHPFRSAFESQPETRVRAGLVDAFLNARENPLSPLEWGEAARRAGLELVAEDQTETSRSDLLAGILHGTRALTRWERLQALDDLLELCANPVLWFRKLASAPASSLTDRNDSSRNGPKLSKSPSESERFVPVASLESALDEAGSGLRRALALLGRADVDADRLRSALEREVGPRVTSRGEPLPGLSLLDYDWARWL